MTQPEKLRYRRDRVLVFTASYPPAWRGGGPIRSVHSAVVRAAERFDVRVVTSATDLGETRLLVPEVNSWLPRPEASVAYMHVDGFRSALNSIRLFIGLRRWRPSIIQLNSFYNPLHSIVPQLYGRLGGWHSAVMVIAVRGEFGAAAKAISARRKKMYLRIYRVLRMDRNVIWQASSANEAVDIRKVFGADARVLIRSNDTLLEHSDNASPSLCENDNRPLYAVFVSRIVPVKGLDGLLRALALVDRPIRVDVIGPPEDRMYAKVCHDLARLLPQHVHLQFVGPLASELVTGAMGNADLLLMPTKGENFGHVIAEALSVSTPVMAMDVTPWTEVLHTGGGIVVADAEPETWAQQINDFARLDRSDRLAVRREVQIAFQDWWLSQPKGDVFSDALAIAKGAN